MVQQLIRDGNMRRRLRNASPIGLIANTMCKFRRTRSVKKLYMASGVESILRPCKSNTTRQRQPTRQLPGPGRQRYRLGELGVTQSYSRILNLNILPYFVDIFELQMRHHT